MINTHIYEYEKQLFQILIYFFCRSTDVTEWTIYAGKTQKALDEPITQQKRQMIKIVDFPNPTNNFLNKDIALVKVDTNFTYNNYVRPICLPWREAKEGDRCFVKGWGETQGNNIKVHIILCLSLYL